MSLVLSPAPLTKNHHHVNDIPENQDQSNDLSKTHRVFARLDVWTITRDLEST